MWIPKGSRRAPHMIPTPSTPRNVRHPYAAEPQNTRPRGPSPAPFPNSKSKQNRKLSVSGWRQGGSHSERVLEGAAPAEVASEIAWPFGSHTIFMFPYSFLFCFDLELGKGAGLGPRGRVFWGSSHTDVVRSWGWMESGSCGEHVGIP